MKPPQTAFLILLALILPCWGGTKHIIADKDADEYAQLALNGFWGKALDENDKPIQPKDEKDRHTVPIPQADARRVAHAGVPAGIAMWAELDWESYYDAFMKKERSSRRWSGKQIAFIGVLFGVAQGNIEKSLENMPRDDKGCEWAAHVLAEARSGLDAGPNQTMEPTANRPYAHISSGMNATRNSRGGSSWSR